MGKVQIIGKNEERRRELSKQQIYQKIIERHDKEKIKNTPYLPKITKAPPSNTRRNFLKL